MSEPQDDRWRALVSCTTADRAGYVRRYLPHLARACVSDPRLDLLVALDGPDPETRAFCRQWDVPLLFSDTREGVGLSKNRVLERFPDYDYYFFLEDDLEVLDGSIFRRHVEFMDAGEMHHMSLFSKAEGGQPTGESTVLGERIVHFSYGSAEFNAFTQEGLLKVGGWHPAFAQFRRWGHTEHSARFPRAGLAPAPFNVAVGLSGSCIRHRPRSVTTPATEARLDAHGISEFERNLISEALTHVPLKTIAPYHVSDVPPGKASRLAMLVDGRARYPLLSSAERRDALADYHVGRAAAIASPVSKAGTLVLAGVLAPRNLALRHAVKTNLLRILPRSPAPPRS
jgi:hypothetical protein